MVALQASWCEKGCHDLGPGKPTWTSFLTPQLQQQPLCPVVPTVKVDTTRVNLKPTKPDDEAIQGKDGELRGHMTKPCKACLSEQLSEQHWAG
jgi:hypothetical protein